MSAAVRRAPHARRFRVVTCLLLVLALGACQARPAFHGHDVPYVATPPPVAVEMLALAGVKADDVVYDLGSGDGRLVVTAARDFGARAVGVEIDGTLVQDAIENAAKAGVTERATFIWQDLFQVPLGDATVVTLYLLPEVNLRLRPKLLTELRPGSRIVSHQFDMGEWRADRIHRAGDHLLHLWIVPARIDGAWRVSVRWPGAEQEWTAVLRQRFQGVSGSFSSRDGDNVAIAGGRVAGDAIDFTAALPTPRGPVAHRFRGRAGADGLAGTVEAEGRPSGAWTARRER